MSKAEFSTLRSVLSSKACTTDCIWHLTWHYSVFFGCWLLLPSRSFHFCYVFVSCVFQMQIQHLPYRSFLPRSQNTYFLYCSKPWSVIVVSYIFSRNTSQLESTTIRLYPWRIQKDSSLNGKASNFVCWVEADTTAFSREITIAKGVAIGTSTALIGTFGHRIETTLKVSQKRAEKQVLCCNTDLTEYIKFFFESAR